MKQQTVSTISELTAVLLVGGLGTRLRSVISDRPKALAPVGEHPFLAYILDQLVAADIGRAVLCTGYCGQQIVHTFGDKYRTLELIYSHEIRPMGTGGALRLALPQIQGDTVLVMNGDSWCEVDLVAFFQWHLSNAHGGASFVLADVADTRRYGRVRTDSDGRIIHFDEKTFVFSGSGQVSAGIYLLPVSWIADISARGPVSLERDVFPGWIGRGIFGYPAHGQFIDIGTPQSYRAAVELLCPVPAIG